MALTDQCMKMLQESPSQSRHEGPKLGHPGNSLFPPLKGSHLVSGSKQLVCFASQRNSTQNFWVSGPVDLHGRVSDEIMSQIQMQMLQPQTLDRPRQGLSTEIGSVGGPEKRSFPKREAGPCCSAGAVHDWQIVACEALDKQLRKMKERRQPAGEVKLYKGCPLTLQ